MADNASRRGATDLGMPLMLFAALVIGGFFYWLSAQVRAERALEIVEDARETEDDPTATRVNGLELQDSASVFEGQRIIVTGLPVASLLGTQGFWMELPNRNPFLVSFSQALRADSVSVSMGERATVTGTVQTVNDSILNAWTESGSITENDRIVAEFATHFLEAERIRTTPGPGGGSP
jgi:hypothetical protein